MNLPRSIWQSVDMEATQAASIFQAALLEVAEATKAAAAAAQACQQTQQMTAATAVAAGAQAASSPSGSPTSGHVDWEEIRMFHDWSWQLVQFLSTIDAEYSKELQQLMDKPSNPLNLESAHQAL